MEALDHIVFVEILYAFWFSLFKFCRRIIWASLLCCMLYYYFVGYKKWFINSPKVNNTAGCIIMTGMNERMMKAGDSVLVILNRKFETHLSFIWQKSQRGQ